MSTSEKLSGVIKKYRHYPNFLGIDISDVNQRGSIDDTMLHIAAWKGELADMEILIGAGANTNARGDLGNTPLHNAAMKGQLEGVKLLLQHGANPNLTNEFGQTPLVVAELGKKTEVVKFLRSGHT